MADQKSGPPWAIGEDGWPTDPDHPANRSEDTQARERRAAYFRNDMARLERDLC